MTELVHADIFFIVTTVAVVLLTVFWAVFLYYVIGIVRDIRAIVSEVRSASDTVASSVERVWHKVSGRGRGTKKSQDAE